ncbi:stage IV sporulation protein FB [Ornithinibacillus gellani]|uniref:site-2 protease family protein n=1 Tax=Ornithinibacillus gellani TaxID=2293253 RepID=UPI000F470A01|nr:site-2 protease family protein [Ornithinibacillus gellani]TQS74710.1 stage IV sporulation protein FB [Ornithinibacillus gellani]
MWLPNIRLHPTIFIFIAVSFMTGTFIQLYIILAIVSLHELGHYMMAKFFKWRVEGMMLWVFGGVMHTDEHGNRPLHEEMLVTIAGPFQHVILYVLIMFAADTNLLSASTIELLYFYNSAILFFNLLPIWPLDGGKILFMLLTRIFPYKKAHQLIIILSMAASIFAIIFWSVYQSFSLSFLLIMLFLFMENRTEWKQRYFVFLRFLLRRYEGNAPIKKLHPIYVSDDTLIMDVFAYFRRDKKHAIYILYPQKERQTIDEMDCLRSYFHLKNYKGTIGELGKRLA